MASRALRVVLAFLAALHVAAFAYVILGRIGYPHELEWMTGSVLDHVERIHLGKPIYAEPTADWIPYIYPPLYYWLAAPFGTSFVACRLLSFGTALLQAGLVFHIATKLGASRGWAAIAVVLFVACFGYTGWWYDIERSDTLFAAMMVGGTAILVERRSVLACAIAGAIVGLGFYAKQPAVFFLAAGAGALLLAAEGERRARIARAATFAIAGGTMIVLGGAVLRSGSGRWFEYYVWTMPRSHGVVLGLLPDVLREDGAGIGLVVATLVLAWWTARDRKDPAMVVFVAMLLAGFAGAFSSRLHVGGWINVLQQWTTFACIAFAIVASRSRSRHHIALAAAAVQLLLLFYDPRLRTPRRSLAADTEKLHALVAKLEERGEVLFVGRGHVTKHRHFQMSALADVVRVDGKSPDDLRRGIEQRRFAAILDDARGKGESAPALWPPVMLEDVDDLREPLLQSYFVSQHVDDAWTDLAMQAPARPRWVYLPRKSPQTGLDRAQLKARQLREMELAVEQAAPDAIEDLAANSPE